MPVGGGCGGGVQADAAEREGDTGEAWDSEANWQTEEEGESMFAYITWEAVREAVELGVGIGLLAMFWGWWRR